MPVSVGQRGGGRSVVEGVVGMPASTAPMLMPADASLAQGRRARHLILNEDKGQVEREWASPKGGMGACRSPNKPAGG